MDLLRLLQILDWYGGSSPSPLSFFELLSILAIYTIPIIIIVIIIIIVNKSKKTKNKDKNVENDNNS